jgi:hypothetical protein
MSWKILFKDGTTSYWPASCWSAEELVKLVSVDKFELIEDKKIKKVA